MKLHLTPTPPNEGARMLARWVLTLPGGLATASAATDTSPEYLQRMIAGEMVPGLAAGSCMQRQFGVRARDFHRPAECGWFETQADEPVRKAA